MTKRLGAPPKPGENPQPDRSAIIKDRIAQNRQLDIRKFVPNIPRSPAGDEFARILLAASATGEAFDQGRPERLLLTGLSKWRNDYNEAVNSLFTAAYRLNDSTIPVEDRHAALIETGLALFNLGARFNSVFYKGERGISSLKTRERQRRGSAGAAATHRKRGESLRDEARKVMQEHPNYSCTKCAAVVAKRLKRNDTRSVERTIRPLWENTPGSRRLRFIGKKVAADP